MKGIKMLQGMESDREIQLARNIYLTAMSIMKYTLNMEERKYEEGRKDERYRFYKQELMKKTYNELRYLFEKLKSQGFLENVAYDENLKNGYKDTDSGGSGYINARALNEVLE